MKIAWEPSIDWNKKFLNKIVNQSTNIPVDLPSSPLKFWVKSIKGFMGYNQTFKQRYRQTEITTLYTGWVKKKCENSQFSSSVPV